jgi:hypothetical protein
MTYVKVGARSAHACRAVPYELMLHGDLPDAEAAACWHRQGRLAGQARASTVYVSCNRH